MRLSTIAVLGGAAAIAFGLTALPASAAPKQTTKVTQRGAEVSSQTRTRRARQAQDRARTRITVTPRSFLDPGTEVLPGERKFMDYAFPPSYSPTQVLAGSASPAGWQNSNWPLPGPFDLPGNNNPRQW
jgi:hypothetical protein